VWRFHPVSEKFEVFAEGTSNPWGIDWDDRGQAFITACVIPHLYHVIPGAHYQRQAGSHFNPNVYDDLKTIADHVHWLGESGPHAANGKSGAAGGGHAHCGALIYQGGAWPREYENSVIMANIHGNRLNRDALVPSGSGFIGKHAPDPVLMNDKWSRLINFKYGPDGSVYMIDWYDRQACHNPVTEVWDRTNGRIYKLSYEGEAGEREMQPRRRGGAEADAEKRDLRTLDLQKLSNEELVKLQLDKNEWYVRHARRILQERGPKAGDAVYTQLLDLMGTQNEPSRQLRLMWALHAVDRFSAFLFQMQLLHADPFVRAWAVRLAVDDLGPVQITRPADPPPATPDNDAMRRTLDTLAQLATSDPSPVVRLAIASALQRIELAERWPILEALVAHGEDANDHNLPLMVWYAAEPAVAADPGRGIELAGRAKIPVVREFIARRLCALAAAEAGGDVAKVKIEPLNRLAALLASTDDAALEKDVLAGMSDGLRGWQRLPSPQGWAAVYEKLSAASGADEPVRAKVQELSVVFGEERALAALRSKVTDANANIGERRNAIEALVGARDEKIVPLLQALVEDPSLRAAAIRGLAAFDDAKTPDLVLGVYENLDTQTKVDALNTLAARPAYAKFLVEAVKAGKLQKNDITAATLRQLAAIDDAVVKNWVEQTFGTVKQTPQEKLNEIAQWKNLLSRKTWADRADPQRGRAVFARTCQQCHTLYDTGGHVGPDLTGSNRADLSYVLSNVVDPSAVIGKDYQLSILKTTDNRVISGIVKKDDGNALQVQTETELLTLPKSAVKLQKIQPISMMPEGLLAGLKKDEVRDLIAYLGSNRQVPMLATPQNAPALFNGKDLAGWRGDGRDLWHVENGEIVGRTTEGIKSNAFLFSDLAARDFKLTLKIKLTPDSGNSGVQFRSVSYEGGEAKGYQADAGKGWWGKLYEENGRKLLVDQPFERYVKPNEWNEYVIEASGSKIRTWINGQPCVDLDDPDGAKQGQFALQIHSGGPTEVRFKDLKLEVDLVPAQ
jgi:putative heme-binding domain-containing protein